MRLVSFHLIAALDANFWRNGSDIMTIAQVEIIVFCLVVLLEVFLPAKAEEHW